MKRALASAVAAALVALSVLGPAGGARAEEAPPPAIEGPGVDVPPAEEPPVEVPPIPDPSPQVAVVLAQLHVLDTQKALADAETVLATAKADEARATSVRDAAKHDLDVKKAALAAAVADAYVRGGPEAEAQATSGDLSPAEYVPLESARVLAGTALDRGLRLVHDADALLGRMQGALDAAASRSAGALAARDTAQAAQAEAALAVTNARRMTNRTDVSPPVMGDAVMTADEIAGWFKTQFVVGYVASVDVPTLAKYYVDEGTAEKVRGDIAFAQSIIETGSFTSPLTTHNNFAGIGACDSCETGFDFLSVQQGVRAQAQLLHAYADRELRLSSLANPAVGSNPDNLSVRGCCPTWNKLTGTWATDPNYGPKIMTIYLSMLQFTYASRTTPTNSGPLSPS
jgi:hypothetical protein